MDIRIILATILLVVFEVSSVEHKEWSSEIKTAQCRANCLDKFLADTWPATSVSCHENLDCNMCWDVCELLSEDFYLWSAMCGESDICFGGCEEACTFHNHVNNNKIAAPRSLPTFRFPAPLTVKMLNEEILAEWQIPQSVGHSRRHHFVYVLTKSCRNHGSTHIAQTMDRSVAIDSSDLCGKKTDFTLLVVAGFGLVNYISTTYTYNPADNNVDLQTNEALYSVRKPWKLHLLNFQYSLQRNYIHAYVSWTRPELTGRGQYEVSWESRQGDKGHMTTYLSDIMLTLLPHSDYVIMVDLVTGDKSTPLHSETLTVDTSAAIEPHDDGFSIHAVHEAPTDSPCSLKTLIIVGVAVTVGTAILNSAILFIYNRCTSAGNDYSPDDTILTTSTEIETPLLDKKSSMQTVKAMLVNASSKSLGIQSPSSAGYTLVPLHIVATQGKADRTNSIIMSRESLERPLDEFSCQPSTPAVFLDSVNTVPYRMTRKLDRVVSCNI